MKRSIPAEAGGNEMDRSRRAFVKKLGLTLTGGLYGIDHLRASQPFNEALPVSSSKDLWSDIQSQFLFDPGITYMNTGTEGSAPKPVFDDYVRILKQFTASPTQATFHDDDLNYFQENNREKVAQFVGAEKDEIVLTGNTTMGINTVLFGLDYAPGDEIITTLHDHIAEISPSKVLRERRDVKFTQLELGSPARSKDEIIRLFERAITNSRFRPKVLLICHINFTTGLRMPVKELCQLARKHDMISIVDGAHALGMLKLDLHDMGCDFYSTAGHKWLNCVPGTGVLYMKGGEANTRNLWPVLSEFYDFRDEDGNLYDIATQMQLRGQNDTPAYMAMVSAIRFQKEIGIGTIEGRILELNNYLRQRIVDTWGKESLLAPPPGAEELSSGMASFIPSSSPPKRYDKEFITAIPEKLSDEYGIWIRYVDFFARRNHMRRGKKTYVLRVSTHIFNDTDQIDRLIEAVEAVA